MSTGNGRKTSLQIAGDVTADVYQGALNLTRSATNIVEVGGVAVGAGIVGKYAGIAPEISDILANVANSIPNAAEVSGVIPSLQNGFLNGISTLTGLPDLPNDMHNLANIMMWLGAISLMKLGLKGLGAQKGRLEAGFHATVWTALSYMFLKEFSEVMVSGQTIEIMNYITNEGYGALANFLPDVMREPLVTAEGRSGLYAGITGTVGIGTSLLALKNYWTLYKGRPKKNSEQNN